MFPQLQAEAGISDDDNDDDYDHDDGSGCGYYSGQGPMTVAGMINLLMITIVSLST